MSNQASPSHLPLCDIFVPQKFFFRKFFDDVILRDLWFSLPPPNQKSWLRLCVESIITSYNKSLLNQDAYNDNQLLPCNCQKKSQCLLDGQCCERSLVYQATLKSANNPDKIYYGSTKMEFKSRFYNHKHRFEHQK